MIDINNFISEYITKRPVSMFAQDIESNKEELLKEIQGKKVLVIGGAGTIGSSFIRAILPFKPIELVVVDISENNSRFAFNKWYVCTRKISNLSY